VRGRRGAFPLSPHAPERRRRQWGAGGEGRGEGGDRSRRIHRVEFGPVSDLPQESLSYQAVVAEYFLGLRGAGLLLSPLDAELVAEWERRGLPVAVVCRGLRDGLEDAARARLPGAPLPRSIRELRLTVESAWRAYRSGRVGEGPAPEPEEITLQRRYKAACDLLASAQTRAPPWLRDGIFSAEQVLERLRSVSGCRLEAFDEAVVQADGIIVKAWAASLPRETRARLGIRLRLLAGPRHRGTTPRAHRSMLQSYLAEAAREAGVISLRGRV
jgi:hypothetical protein